MDIITYKNLEIIGMSRYADLQSASVWMASADKLLLGNIPLSESLELHIGDIVDFSTKKEGFGADKITLKTPSTLRKRNKK